MKPDSTIYRGYAEDRSVTVDGKDLSPKKSQKLFNHSPDGFNWGYGGSGPAQLALALMLDYFGNQTSALKTYQKFKFAIISHLPMDKDWEITGEKIYDELFDYVCSEEFLKRDMK